MVQGTFCSVENAKLAEATSRGELDEWMTAVKKQCAEHRPEETILPQLEDADNDTDSENFINSSHGIIDAIQKRIIGGNLVDALNWCRDSNRFARTTTNMMPAQQCL